MKILVLIARILLGLVFFAFGLIGFLPFVPKGTMPTGLAGQFVTALIQSHYGLVVDALQMVGGVLLLANRYVPLGLTILGPIIVNRDHRVLSPPGFLRPFCAEVSVAPRASARTATAAISHSCFSTCQLTAILRRQEPRSGAILRVHRDA
jgi:putative oxidoreductase